MATEIDQLMWTGSPARRFSLSMIAAVLVADLVGLPFSALTFGAANLAVVAVIVGLFFVAGRLQRRYEFSPAARHFAVEVYILVLFGAVGFVFSYLAIENGLAVRDDWFAAFDRRLGFDWQGYTAFVLQDDWLRPMSLVLYVITPPLVGVALFRDCYAARFDRASEIVATVALCGILCVLLSGIVPSVGGSGYFVTDPGFYGDHFVVFDDAYKRTFFELRDGTGMEVFLLKPVALIAFPSYHAGLSLLVVMAFRGSGAIGWIVLALNIGTLLSLPVQGGHYLSDVLGGLLVGAAAFWAVRRVKLPGTFV
ncbi:MAG: phosphatase PAP2 family protein [Gammaproteobacteria bacterium]|nr:phosphatase PAP2 family protein [Gammaproteobacteria bacterium]MDH4254997.1 phosphatase PAP2 family protein [Gammaproteobacteria bacterium]MDH5311578.1 phosphatase PAP2 family protein [Gammaproteobacteria bacterium]